jgi:hypothetical protein
MATLMLKDYFRRRTTLSGRARTTMDQEPIANAIKTLTDHIRHHSHNTAWDIRHVPTPIEIKARKDAIEATCKKLDVLGQHPDARFPDFEFLRHKLAQQSSFPMLTHLHAVVDAFQKAGRLDPKQT